MPLIPGKFATELAAFIAEANITEQTHLASSIANFCAKQESILYTSIKSITITIPPGAINVLTPQGPGSNIIPIVLTGVIT